MINPDQELRLEALKLASAVEFGCDDAELIVKRAEAYLNFLDPVSSALKAIRGVGPDHLKQAG